MPIRVAIVEDEQHYSNALKKIIDFDVDLHCVGQIYDGNDAVKKLPGMMPDVVLMDIKMPFMYGYDVISVLKESMPDTQFMMCTSFEDDENIFKSLKAGASGYLVKGDSMSKIIMFIKEIYKGGAPMSFTIAKRVLHYFHQKKEEINAIEDLTKTEKEILNLLSEGLQYKEIAAEKNVTLDTVKKHIGNIYRKLHVNNRIEAINFLNKSR